MRIGGKAGIASVLVVLVVAIQGAHSAAVEPQGITIAPAALKLELKKGQGQASTQFGITNHYRLPVTLHFAFEQSAGVIHPADPRGQLHFESADVTLAAGTTMDQAITLYDATTMAPGSQLVDVVVTQQDSAVSGVGVLPSMRVPVTLIKDDGAIASLGVAKIVSPHFALRLPAEITVNLRNTGNMITIPRGTVTLASPNGVVIGKGVLNEGSIALPPGGERTLTTKLTRLTSAFIPGPYTVQVSYGRGGDSPAKTAVAQVVFIAWWHPLIVLGAFGLVRYGCTHRRRFYKKPYRLPGSLRRATVTGRGGS